MFISRSNVLCAVGLALAVLWSAAVVASEAYKADAGPFEVVIAADVELDFPELEKQLPLRVAYPGAPGPHPVIVFSHGGGCEKATYSRLTDHWASYGYVVIEPTHTDSRSLGFSFATMEPDVMTKVCTRKLRSTRKRTTAMRMDLAHSTTPSRRSTASVSGASFSSEGALSVASALLFLAIPTLRSVLLYTRVVQDPNHPLGSHHAREGVSSSPSSSTAGVQSLPNTTDTSR
jgi:hypothetical protein